MIIQAFSSNLFFFEYHCEVKSDDIPTVMVQFHEAYFYLDQVEQIEDKNQSVIMVSASSLSVRFNIMSSSCVALAFSQVSKINCTSSSNMFNWTRAVAERVNINDASIIW